jgi:hypothetical protein
MGFLYEKGFDEAAMMTADRRIAKCRTHIAGLATACASLPPPQQAKGIGLLLPDKQGNFTRESSAGFKLVRLQGEGDARPGAKPPTQAVNVEYYTQKGRIDLGAVALIAAEEGQPDQPIHRVGTGEMVTAVAFEELGQIKTPDVRFRMALHVLEGITLPPSAQ